MSESHPTPAAGSASDLRLVEGVADVLATPREDPADSFVLHAPLELVARTALLPFVAPGPPAPGGGQIAGDGARPGRGDRHRLRGGRLPGRSPGAGRARLARCRGGAARPRDRGGRPA